MSNAPNAEHLRAFVERIEHEEAAKADIAEGIKEIYQEAKSSGYDARIIKKLIAIRRKKSEAAAEEAELLSLYADALGMQGSFGF